MKKANKQSLTPLLLIGSMEYIIFFCIISFLAGYYFGSKKVKPRKAEYKYAVELETERKEKEEKKPPNVFASDEIELTEEFKNALYLMEIAKSNIYITGKAGTGKSTLLKHFCYNTSKNIVVLAPTGVAAINIQGATLHSFFQFPFGIIEEKDVKQVYRKKDIFKKLDAIVIDEISMVRADLMSAIDYSLRLNTGNKNKPFGGIQVIMFGDLFQLPPVVKGNERDYLNDNYGGVYFFNSLVFQEVDLEKIQLTKIFRQKDSSFKELLNKIRENNLTQSDLDALNSRYCYCDSDTKPAITLACTNKVVNNINIDKLNEIKSKEYVYHASVQGNFKEKDYPAEKELRLKEGAQIMMIKNDVDNPRRWVNGSLGIVEKLKNDYISVRLDGRSHKIEKVKWEILDYKYNQEENRIEKYTKGVFTQFPLKLAWAVTIHKSQGKTFNRVVIDLGTGAFAHGQTYVALSRCTNFEDIYLKTAIKYSDIILDDAVKNFHLD